MTEKLTDLEFWTAVHDFFLAIEGASIDPGNVEVQCPYQSIEIHTWYAHGAEERKTADSLVALIFGLDFTTSQSIGFTYFIGTWHGLNVTILASDSAGYCRKVQVGEQLVPAIEEHTEPVYEWQCAEPILEEARS